MCVRHVRIEISDFVMHTFPTVYRSSLAVCAEIFDSKRFLEVVSGISVG